MNPDRTPTQAAALAFIAALEAAEKAGDRNAYAKLSRLFGADWQGAYRHVPGTVYDAARAGVADKGGRYLLSDRAATWTL